MKALDQRLAELQAEHQKGIGIQQQLQVQLQDMIQTVLRIEGAISLCNELIEEAKKPVEAPPADPTPTEPEVPSETPKSGEEDEPK